MQCTQILLDEHACILDMLSCLAKLAEDAGRGEPIDPQAALELLLLFESFADGLHQHKEEQGLFPVLLERVSPEDEAELGALVADHRDEWSRMMELDRALRAHIGGDAAAGFEFAQLSRTYIRLQRGHLVRENRLLIDLATKILDAEADDRILRRFTELEAAERDTRGVFEQVHALCKRLGVDARASES